MSAISLSHYNLRADRDQMMLLKNFYCEFVGLKGGRVLPSIVMDFGCMPVIRQFYICLRYVMANNANLN